MKHISLLSLSHHFSVWSVLTIILSLTHSNLCYSNEKITQEQIEMLMKNLNQGTLDFKKNMQPALNNQRKEALKTTQPDVDKSIEKLKQLQLNQQQQFNQNIAQAKDDFDSKYTRMSIEELEKLGETGDGAAMAEIMLRMQQGARQNIGNSSSPNLSERINPDQWLKQSRNDYFFRQKDKLANGKLDSIETVVENNLKDFRNKFEQCGDQISCYEKTSRDCTSLLAEVGEFYLRAGFYDFAEIYADAAHKVLEKRVLGKEVNLSNHVCLHKNVPSKGDVFSVVNVSSAGALSTTYYELGKIKEIRAILATMPQMFISSTEANGLIQQEKFNDAKKILLKKGNSGLVESVAPGLMQFAKMMGESKKALSGFKQAENSIKQELIARLDFATGNYPEVIQHGSNKRHLLARALLKTRTDDTKLQNLIEENNRKPGSGSTPEEKLLLALEFKVLEADVNMTFGNHKQSTNQLLAVIDEYIRTFKGIRTSNTVLQLVEHPLFRSREIPLMHNIMRIGQNLLLNNPETDLAEKLFFLAQTQTAYTTTAAIDNFSQRHLVKQNKSVDLLRRYQDTQRKIRKLMAIHRYQILYRQESLAKNTFTQLSKTQDELKNFTDEIQNNKNAIDKVKEGTLLSITDIQKHLGKDEALIAYILLDKLAIHPNLDIFDFPDAKSYAWVITQNSKHLVDLNIAPSKIKIAKDSIISDMSLGDTSMNKSSRSAAYSLFKGVFEPLEKLLQGKENISVITGGALDGVPFQMFLREKLGRVKSYQHAPFLVRDYAFSYLESTQKPQRIDNINILVYL